jgi:hypothetical protein
MKTWFQGFGPLRLVLIAVVAVLIAVGPFSGGSVRFDGLHLITTLVAPVAYAIFIFVLPLDMMMSLVFMSGAGEEKRAALKRVILTEGLLLVAMLLAWLPFVLTLLRLR